MYKPQKLEFVVLDISPETANLLWNDVVHFIEDRGFDVTGAVTAYTEIETALYTEKEYKKMLEEQDEDWWFDPCGYYSNEDEHDD